MHIAYLKNHLTFMVNNDIIQTIETRHGSFCGDKGGRVFRSPCIFLRETMTKKRVIAYIDGFNLFYSCLKGGDCKWLDLVKLCESYLRADQELVAVKYFSALVNSTVGDPTRTNRQKLYLSALAANPKIQIELGYFSVHPTKMPRAEDWTAGKIVPVDVIKTEEKGTDVNLAVHMVADAFQDKFDCAMLFSNDSDMSTAVKIVTQTCKKTVGLYIDRKAVSFKVLRDYATYVSRITPTRLKNNQLDAIICSSNQVIAKPEDW